MRDRPIIVYPDADAETIAAFNGALSDRAKAVGDFTFYEGQPTSDAEYLERIGDADLLMLGWKLPDTVLSALPNVKMIAFTGIGAANHVNLKIAAERGITVTNTPGYADQTVAEHVIGLMLCAARNLIQLDQDSRNGGWNRDLPAFDLNGKTLGLIGLGGIGTRTAKLAQAFGMETIAWTQNPSVERAKETGVTFAEMKDVLRQSDIISLHLSLTPQTENLIGEAEISCMKPTAILINTARGEVINEDALIKALNQNQIQLAALDVFSQEPLPLDHPFRSMENVIMTPHVGYNTPEANFAINDITLKSIEAYAAGTPINVVTEF